MTWRVSSESEEKSNRSVNTHSDITLRTSMPTYACTGSNGFIASHLITKMLEQASVRAIVRREMDAPELNCLRELQACWLCGIHL